MRWTVIGLAVLLVVGCGGGGGGSDPASDANGDGSGTGTGGPSSSWESGTPAGLRGSAEISNLEVGDVIYRGDRYVMLQGDAEIKAALESLWATLTAPASYWLATGTTTTYEFWEEASGSRYRFSGFDVRVGQIVAYTVGSYYSPDGSGPYRAASVGTWTGDVEFIVLASETIMYHAQGHGVAYIPYALEFEAR